MTENSICDAADKDFGDLLLVARRITQHAHASKAYRKDINDLGLDLIIGRLECLRK